MNTEMETKKKRVIIAILALFVGLYLVIRKRKQNDLYYGCEEYDSYGKSTRKSFNFLLLVVVLFRLGMKIKNKKGVLESVSNMLQYAIKKEMLWAINEKEK
ncbi:hypothetical protein [Bacillus cereus group sp. BfR-BA-01380]|uniref:hypothetical protein n=1 Tax=Bacillus cereus group sp. BfR-BA-01380 TaxID=2920324 RepID=UPI001F5660A8|nr:hypothetical protein [Bacillus cereus group sp. BfR-BA-01380]